MISKLLPALALFLFFNSSNAMYNGAVNYKSIHEAQADIPNGKYLVQSVSTGLYLQFARRNGKTDSTILKSKVPVNVEYRKRRGSSGLRQGVYEGIMISGGNNKCLSSQFGYAENDPKAGRCVAAVSYVCRDARAEPLVKQYWNAIPCGPDSAIAVSLAQRFGTSKGSSKSPHTIAWTKPTSRSKKSATKEKHTSSRKKSSSHKKKRTKKSKKHSKWGRVTDPKNPKYKYHKYCQQKVHKKNRKCTQKPHRLARRSVLPSFADSAKDDLYITRRYQPESVDHGLKRRDLLGLSVDLSSETRVLEPFIGSNHSLENFNEHDQPLIASLESMNLSVLDGQNWSSLVDELSTAVSLREKRALSGASADAEAIVEDLAGRSSLARRARSIHGRRKVSSEKRASSSRKSKVVCLFAEDHLMDQIPVAVSAQAMVSFGGYVSQSLSYWTNPFDEHFQWRFIPV